VECEKFGNFRIFWANFAKFCENLQKFLKFSPQILASTLSTRSAPRASSCPCLNSQSNSHSLLLFRSLSCCHTSAPLAGALPLSVRRPLPAGHSLQNTDFSCPRLAARPQPRDRRQDAPLINCFGRPQSLASAPALRSLTRGRPQAEGRPRARPCATCRRNSTRWRCPLAATESERACSAPVAAPVRVRGRIRRDRATNWAASGPPSSGKSGKPSGSLLRNGARSAAQLCTFTRFAPNCLERVPSEKYVPQIGPYFYSPSPAD